MKYKSKVIERKDILSQIASKMGNSRYRQQAISGFCTTVSTHTTLGAEKK